MVVKKSEGLKLIIKSCLTVSWMPGSEIHCPEKEGVYPDEQAT